MVSSGFFVYICRTVRLDGFVDGDAYRVNVKNFIFLEIFVFDVFLCHCNGV